MGAGISGLLVAKTLNEKVGPLRFWTSRDVGGRMATRRIGRGNFDHGAQFFTVRGERFGLVEDWLGAGVATEWTRGFADPEGRPNEDGYPRYRGTEGMTSIPKYISRGLDVRTGEKAVRVDDTDDGWEVVCESGSRVAGTLLVLAAPVPQALDLASSGSYSLPDGARRQLEAISYDPCLALMVLLDGSTGVPEPEECRSRASPWTGSATTGARASPKPRHGPRRTGMEPLALRGRRDGDYGVHDLARWRPSRHRSLARRRRDFPRQVALQLGYEPPPRSMPHRLR